MLQFGLSTEGLHPWLACEGGVGMVECDLRHGVVDYICVNYTLNVLQNMYLYSDQVACKQVSGKSQCMA